MENEKNLEIVGSVPISVIVSELSIRGVLLPNLRDEKAFMTLWG